MAVENGTGKEHTTPHDNARTIRVGIIGYGSASKIFHAPLIRTTPGMRIAAISSSDPAKVIADFPDAVVMPAGADALADAAARATGDAHADTPLAVVADADALITRDDIDLVIIPTPNATHFALARAALQHGKHVVVDKPFTLNLNDAQTLATLVTPAATPATPTTAHDAKQNRLLTVFHNRRWDADFLAVKGLIERGELGHVSQFESTFNYYRPEPRERWRERAGEGGGLWNDLGPHLVDQAVQLFGLPEAVYLDAGILRAGGQTDDYFTAILRYADKRAILRVNASAGLTVPRFVIQGSKASFRKDGIDPQEDALRAGQLPGGEGTDWGCDTHDGTLTHHADGTTSRVVTPNGDYPAFYAGVRDALLGKAAAPVSLDSALAVVAILDLGRKSATARAELPFFLN